MRETNSLKEMSKFENFRGVVRVSDIDGFQFEINKMTPRRFINKIVGFACDVCNGCCRKVS